MCGRFELDANPRQVARQFDLPNDPSLPNLSEIKPTDTALIIEPDRTATLRSWGIPAPWDGNPIFNARSETLLEKPVFAPFLAHRCIVPATAFPEWRKDGKQRFRYRISLSSDGSDETPIMAFAGLYDASHFTVTTCPACDRIAPVHSRMPVILTEKTSAMWLNQTLDIATAAKSLTPYSADDLNVEEDFSPKQKPDEKQPDLFT